MRKNDTVKCPNSGHYIYCRSFGIENRKKKNLKYVVDAEIYYPLMLNKMAENSQKSFITWRPFSSASASCT